MRSSLIRCCTCQSSLFARKAASAKPGPQVEAPGLDIERGAVELDGAERIDVDLGLRLGDGLVHAGNRLRLGEPAHQAARLVDIGLRQEGELGDALRLDVRLRLGRHRDAAGNGACDGAQLAHVALQEAPAGGRVEGEGLALQVVTAGGLAGFEVDAFAHVVVGAEIVRALGDDEPPLLRERGGREGKKREREQQ